MTQDPWLPVLVFVMLAVFLWLGMATDRLNREATRRVWQMWRRLFRTRRGR